MNPTYTMPLTTEQIKKSNKENLTKLHYLKRKLKQRKMKTN